MSYLDRLRSGNYTSPSGRGFNFLFDDLGRQGGKKSATLEIPQSDSAIVQDLGGTATRFDLEIYFSGIDYDETADGFYAALAEPGPGLLAHPRWGDISVLATSYSQTERFVDGMGRAVFAVSFVYAPGTAVTASANTAAAVASAGKVSNAAARRAAVATYKVPVLSDLASCKDRVKKTVRGVRQSIMRVVSGLRQISQQINAELTAIESDIDGILASPQLLADAIGGVIQAAVEAPVDIGAKIAAYGDMLVQTFSDPPETEAQAAIAVLTASAIAAAAVEASADGTLNSRDSAVGAHDDLVNLYRSAREVIELCERSGNYTSDPLAMAALAQAAAQAAAYLLEASFSLRVERRAILDGAATPLELVYRFYGDLDRLDEFEQQNHLQGDAVLIVPAGTEVRYYAQ
jgi:prophage DNA circulation protein